MNALLLVPVALALAAGESRQTTVTIGRDVVVSTGTKVREVVAIGGSVTVDGEVEDAVVSVGGPARVNGKIGDDLVVIGSAVLGPKAVIGGELVVVGGPLEAAPTAKVKGDRTSVSLADVKDKAWAERLSRAGGWLKEALFKGRLIDPARPWNWTLALACLLAYVLLAAAAAGPVEACVEVFRRQPLQALLAGILILSFLGPLSLAFVVSVFGIALLPAVAGVVLVGAWLGKAALLRLTGAQLTGGVLRGPAAVGAAGVLLLLLYAVPFLGLPVWALVSAWGLGAAALAGFEGAGSLTTRAAAPAPLPAPADAGLPRASFGERLGATAIDVVAVAVMAGIAPVLTFGVGAWAVYQVALWTWKGTTLGGIVVGIRGVRLDGRPMDLTVAAVRHLASWFSAFACFAGFLWSAWDPESQTWHDKIAGTVVVRVPKTEPLV